MTGRIWAWFLYGAVPSADTVIVDTPPEDGVGAAGPDRPATPGEPVTMTRAEFIAGEARRWINERRLDMGVAANFEEMNRRAAAMQADAVLIHNFDGNRFGIAMEFDQRAQLRKMALADTDEDRKRKLLAWCDWSFWDGAEVSRIVRESRKLWMMYVGNFRDHARFFNPTVREFRAAVFDAFERAAVCGMGVAIDAAGDMPDTSIEWAAAEARGGMTHNGRKLPPLPAIGYEPAPSRGTPWATLRGAVGFTLRDTWEREQRQVPRRIPELGAFGNRQCILLNTRIPAAEAATYLKQGHDIAVGGWDADAPEYCAEIRAAVLA